MAFTSPGADLVLSRNSFTGKLDLQWDSTGNPVYGDDMSHAVLSLVFERKGEWATYPEDTTSRGSYLWTIAQDRKSTPSKAKAYVEEALSPLVDAKKILNLVVFTSRPQPGRLDLNITYQTPGGQTVVLNPTIGY